MEFPSALIAEIKLDQFFMENKMQTSVSIFPKLRQYFTSWKPPRLLKRYLTLPTIIVLAFGAALIGCGGNRPDEPESPPPSLALSVFVSGRDVYVAGRKYDPSQNKYVMTLWENGAPQYLTTQQPPSLGASVFVSGGDVHVVGNQTNGNPNISPAYWKNCFPQQLNSIAGMAYSVFVSGEDVYVAGFFIGGQVIGGQATVTRAILLKNGVPQSMDFSGGGEGRSVYVANGDVYVAGDRSEQGKTIATLWKNGVVQNLGENLDAGISRSSATSVFVSDEDVYVAGYADGDRRYPVLWINGTPRYLQSQTSCDEFLSVFASGGDYYIVGSVLRSDEYLATLWKNNEPGQSLAPYSKSSSSYAHSVFVSDGDVYVAGVENFRRLWDKPEALPPALGASVPTASVARLWKNGVAQELK